MTDYSRLSRSSLTYRWEAPQRGPMLVGNQHGCTKSRGPKQLGNKDKKYRTNTPAIS